MKGYIQDLSQDKYTHTKRLRHLKKIALAKPRAIDEYRTNFDRTGEWMVSNGSG